MADSVREAITHQPEFRIADDINPEDKLVLESISNVIHQDPDLAKEGLDLYAAAPEHTESLIGFIKEHPEGAMALLQNWGELWRNKLDFDLEFDPETEQAVTNDVLYRKDISEFQQTQDERIRDRFRKRRLEIFFRRSKNTAA